MTLEQETQKIEELRLKLKTIDDALQTAYVEIADRHKAEGRTLTDVRPITRVLEIREEVEKELCERCGNREKRLAKALNAPKERLHYFTTELREYLAARRILAAEGRLQWLDQANAFIEILRENQQQ